MKTYLRFYETQIQFNYINCMAIFAAICFSGSQVSKLQSLGTMMCLPLLDHIFHDEKDDNS
jgi:hypothetical protein